MHILFIYACFHIVYLFILTHFIFESDYGTITLIMLSGYNLEAVGM